MNSRHTRREVEFQTAAVTPGLSPTLAVGPALMEPTIDHHYIGSDVVLDAAAQLLLSMIPTRTTFSCFSPITGLFPMQNVTCGPSLVLRLRAKKNNHQN
ncbi:hypothetical protein V6N13_058800 [Hibiscus sabdariffa]